MSRSSYKGPFFLEKKFANQRLSTEIYNKSLQILPEYINTFVRVYNGKRYVKVKITDRMVGYKFGEFIYTRLKHVYKKKKK